MSVHLHCPLCGELLAEDQSMVVMSTREGTRQETYDLACRCGTRLRLQLPPERWSPPRRRRRGRGRAKPRRGVSRVEVAAASDDKTLPSPTAERPFPFTPWQYARLLVLRGRVQDGEMREPEEESADGGATPP
ncbi:MAG TPA: hypothetical protein VK066_28610 [Chloroflexota bacterium]|nr:hypothetical protein [Chloroflexota bacterium]